MHSASLRARRDAARRGVIANYRLKIENCKLIGRLNSIFNFQSAIFNLQLALLLFLLTAPARAEIQLPEANQTAPIRISAQAGNRWQLGVYDVWVLRGNCTIWQGAAVATCSEAVLWIDRAEATENRPNKVIAYLEGDVKIVSSGQPDAAQLTDQTWFGRFYSVAAVEVRAATTAGRPDALPPIYWRGMERRAPEPANLGQSPVRPAQYMAPYNNASPPNAAQQHVAQPPSAEQNLLGQPGAAVPQANTRSALSGQPAAHGGSGDSPIFAADAPLGNVNSAVPQKLGQSPGGPLALPKGVRRIRVYPRSNVPVQIKWFPDPAGNQWIGVIHSGVNVIVDTVGGVPGFGEVGTIDISTDRLVIWVAGNQMPDLAEMRQDQRVPLELYMEGNIVFRQGERVIQAERMYYDVPNQVGTVLKADLLTPAPKYQGLLRLHADVLQQTGPNRFFAQNSFITSSRMGEPSYRLQSNEMYFQDVEQGMVDPLTGQPVLDPATNLPAVEHQRQATASNNFLYLGSVPVFYWPMMATDLNDPAYYIRRAQLRNDSVYGMQILTHWSGYELLGIRNPPKDTDFDVRLDYLGDRGFGHGASFQYDREGVFGIPGHVAGLADYWGIYDHGKDNLGRGRMNLVPEKKYRYRLFWNHRQMLPWDLRLSAEVGWISDRNFLEEYFKREWETLKDETTGLELKRITENRDWSITAGYRVNDFFTQTNWLPRADHYWLGQSLFHDVFTWYEHSQAAYGQFQRLTSAEQSEGPAVQLSAMGNGVVPGRAIRHPPGDRLALPARRGQGGPLRPGRGGPLGRGPERATPEQALRTRRSAGEPAHMEGRSHGEQRTAERPRPGPQGGLRRRVFLRRRKPRHLTARALRSAGRRFARSLRAAVRDLHVRLAVDHSSDRFRHSAAFRRARSTPCGPGCKTGSPRRAPKSPTT